MFLMHDNKISWARLSLGIAGAVVICGALVIWFDKPVFAFIREFDGSWARVISAVSNFKFLAALFGGAFLVTAVMRIWRRYFGKPPRRWLRDANITALYVASSVALAGIIAFVLKVFIGRMRPVLWEALGQTGFYPPRAEWVFNSMPSGHTAASFAALCIFGLLWPRYRIPAWIAATIIGVSRIAVGAHWPSDVVLGAAVGVISAASIRTIFARISRKYAV
ncbi:MAG: phosphatase PAP2 family protein [Alphaproteobacteria bacterium]|nr:phosphatase PAP2 family protein [Alphaproteobacteria bacterium]